MHNARCRVTCGRADQQLDSLRTDGWGKLHAKPRAKTRGRPGELAARGFIVCVRRHPGHGTVGAPKQEGVLCQSITQQAQRIPVGRGPQASAHGHGQTPQNPHSLTQTIRMFISFHVHDVLCSFVRRGARGRFSDHVCVRDDTVLRIGQLDGTHHLCVRTNRQVLGRRWVLGGRVLAMRSTVVG